MLALLARNLLQGGKERHSEILRVMCLTTHLIDPQHHLFPGGLLGVKEIALTAPLAEG